MAVYDDRTKRALQKAMLQDRYAAEVTQRVADKASTQPIPAASANQTSTIPISFQKPNAGATPLYSPPAGVEDFIKSANVGFTDNRAYGEYAMKNLQANGFTEYADALQKQFDEMDLSEDDLRKRQAEEQKTLDGLMQQRDLYIGMMAGGGQLTEEQQAELQKIESAIETAWNNVDSYSIRAETKRTSDWMDRNLAEIRQAEQDYWNPEGRKQKLDGIGSTAARAQEEKATEDGLLSRLQTAAYNPAVKELLTKELMEQGYSRKQISSWIDYAQRLTDEEYAREYEKKWQEKGADMRVGQAFRRSTANNLIGGIGAIGAWGQKLENAFTGKDTPLNFNSTAMLPSIKAQAIRAGKTEDIEKKTEGWIGSDTAFGNLYSGAFNLGASMVDSGTIAALTAAGVPAWAGSLALGSAAASSTMRDAEERGVPADRALMLGTIAGLTEMAFEKFSIESLMDNIDNPETIRQLLKQAAKQGGIESTEEGFTTLVNAAADMLIAGDYSEYEIAKRNYMASGMTEEAAAKKASSDFLKGLLVDIGGGFLSGDIMATAFGGTKLAMRPQKVDVQPTAPDNQQTQMDADMQNAFADMPTVEQRLEQAAQDLMGQKNTAPVNETGAESTAVNTDPAAHTPPQNVNGNIGTVGAKKSQFPHKVKKSQTNAIDTQETLGGIPPERRKQYTHDEVTDEETLYTAQLRLDQDFDGEMEYLASETQWTDDDVDTAYLIRNRLQQEAKESGTEEAWDDYEAWRDVLAQHGSGLGSGLHALAKWARKTGSKIVERASADLDTARDGTNRAETMNTVAKYADQYDTAKNSHDVDGLRRIITETSAARRTGTLRKNQLSKQMNWALDRICDYAKQELSNSGGVDGTNYNVGKFYDFLEDFAASGIEAIATDKQKTDTGKAITTFQRMAMLSKISTVLRNLVNNGIFDPVDSLSNNVSAAIDSLLAGITGTRSIAFEKFTSKEKRKGSLDGLAMAMLSVGLDVNADGVSGKYQNSSNRTWHMSNNFFSKVMSQWEKYMGYAMVATDEFSKGGIQSEVQRGIDRLYEQGKIKDDTLRNAGEEMAKYRTLQKDGRMSKFVTRVRDAANEASRDLTGKLTDGKLELEAGNLLVPFAQVPANVPGVIVDYSPVGLGKGVLKLTKVLIDAKRGKLTAEQQASAVRDIGRGLTGSAMLACAAGLSSLGLIRVVNPGGSEEDENKSADLKASGMKGTQWNLSATVRSLTGKSTEWQDDDVLMSVSFLEPINAFLTAGALLAEDEDGKITPGEFADASLTAAIDAYLELPMFQTAKSTIDAYRYSDADSAGGKFVDALEQAGANLVTGFIPNPVKGIAQGLDPYQRDLYSGDTFGERVRDQFRGVFNRDALPIKQDVYGNDMKNENRFLNFMNSNILPGAITKYTESDLQNALRMMEEETGSMSAYLTKNAPSSVKANGKDVELSDGQKRSYMTARGDAYEFASSALQGSDMFQNFPTSFKQKAYDVAEDYAVQTAKESLDIGFEPDGLAADFDKPTRMELLDAIMQKTIESMAGNKKLYGNKYEGIAKMRQDKTIDDATALALLTDSQFEKYNEFCTYADVPVTTYLQILGYSHIDGKQRKQEEMKAQIERVTQDNKQRRALWCTLYSKNTIPGNWWN